MRKKTKRLLLFATILFFLLAAPATIYYCRGYRFDFKRRKIVQTGALFFHTRPKGATIYINGEKKKKTNFFFGSALIENLLPGTYRVRIKKSGFKPWKKTLEVEEKKVTSGKNITLLPESLRLKLLSKRVLDFWPFPQKGKVLISKKEKDFWSLKSLDPESGVTSLTATETEIEKLVEAEIKAPPENLIWHPEGEWALVEMRTSGEEEKRVFVSLSPEAGRVRPFPLPQKAREIRIGTEGKRVFFLNETEDRTSLWWKGPEKERKKVLDRVSTFELSGKEIYFLDQKGRLKKADLEGESRTLSLSPLPGEKGGKTRMKMAGGRIFVFREKTLFLYREKERDFKRIRGGVKQIRVSPKGGRVGLADSHSLEVLYLEKQSSQPRREKGEVAFLGRFSGKTEDLFWLTDHYLLLGEKPGGDRETRIKVVETDDRDRAQTWNLAGFSSPELFFSPERKNLFVLTYRRLFFAEPL